MRSLMWFRSDLRVRDNTALHNACRDARRGVLAVYALCPGQWRQHDWASIKVDFELRNLACLSQSLQKLNIPLLIVEAGDYAKVPRRLLRLAKEHACDGLYFNQEYEVDERRRDAKVTSCFEADGRSVRMFKDQVVFGPEEIRTRQGQPYTVFSAFCRKWCEMYKSESAIHVLPVPKRQPELPVVAGCVPQKLRGFAVQPGSHLWPAGETYARRRLRRFVEKKLGDYHKTRDFPALNGTSQLSPYLRSGVLSARQCFMAALEANRGKIDLGLKGATIWMTELIWREFYRHILVAFPRVSMGRAFRVKTEGLPWRYDEKLFAAWCQGRTGVPIVDAAMRQLAQTGWMHNRLRMVVSMFLTKDLFIDWRWGEKYFMQHLIDGDLASNNGGWQWSASTGTDAVPYFRVFNPYNQSRRFDPEGVFIRQYVPEFAKYDAETIHEPYASRDSACRKMDYPEPIVDHAQARQHVMRVFSSLRQRKSR